MAFSRPRFERPRKRWRATSGQVETRHPKIRPDFSKPEEMTMTDLSPPPVKHSWARPAGTSFEAWMKSRIARVADRPYDWSALKFQADFDPKYRRAQKRFIGTGGTGVNTDSNVIAAEHFTLSNMILPVGAESPMH